MSVILRGLRFNADELCVLEKVHDKISIASDLLIEKDTYSKKVYISFFDSKTNESSLNKSFKNKDFLIGYLLAMLEHRPTQAPIYTF